MERQSGRDMSHSYVKFPSINKKFEKKQSDRKTPTRTSTTQRLRTDSGRPVGEITAIKQVLLDFFTGS